jgi:hypothetical protein
VEPTQVGPIERETVSGHQRRHQQVPPLKFTVYVCSQNILQLISVCLLCETGHLASFPQQNWNFSRQFCLRLWLAKMAAYLLQCVSICTHLYLGTWPNRTPKPSLRSFASTCGCIRRFVWCHCTNNCYINTMKISGNKMSKMVSQKNRFSFFMLLCTLIYSSLSMPTVNIVMSISCVWWAHGKRRGTSVLCTQI